MPRFAKGSSSFGRGLGSSLASLGRGNDAGGASSSSLDSFRGGCWCRCDWTGKRRCVSCGSSSSSSASSISFDALRGRPFWRFARSASRRASRSAWRCSAGFGAGFGSGTSTSCGGSWVASGLYGIAAVPPPGATGVRRRQHREHMQHTTNKSTMPSAGTPNARPPPIWVMASGSPLSTATICALRPSSAGVAGSSSTLGFCAASSGTVSVSPLAGGSCARSSVAPCSSSAGGCHEPWSAPAPHVLSASGSSELTHRPAFHPQTRCAACPRRPPIPPTSLPSAWRRLLRRPRPLNISSSRRRTSRRKPPERRLTGFGWTHDSQSVNISQPSAHRSPKKPGAHIHFRSSSRPTKHLPLFKQNDSSHGPSLMPGCS
mmetsp:Transcript_7989/g.24585  ORF Transcript_7989/g.24585 Transcript_7989/m.24585 type:complete len:374 (+) Transcript_7989:547-1668(+)